MNHSQRLSFLALIVLLLAFGEQTFAVGALFCRRIGTSTEYEKMWIKTVSADIEIQGQIAVTHVDQMFFNEKNSTVEAIYIFPLPENATMTELVYWFNGEHYVANIRERQAAVQDYNQTIRRNLDPALLEYLGDNLFRLSIAPINALSEVRTEITYMEPLNYDLGIVYYTFLLNTLELSPHPLLTVSVDVDVQTATMFKRFASPSHQSSTATQIQQLAANHYTLFYGDENFLPDKDLQIEFEVKRENVDMQILTYSPAPADSFGTDSFYALWINPPDTIENEEIIPKDIVFTVDVSSSMEGVRIQQVKKALNNFLDLLNPDDRFNIISFGTFVSQFQSDLVPVNFANITQAKDFVYQLYALGMTNISQALTNSLQQSYGEQTSNNLVFLTDGRPTWGETFPDSIIAQITRLNSKGVRIFPFGVGEDLNRLLLKELALNNHGYAKFITADDSIAVVVNDHFLRISKPVLQNINLDFGGLMTWDQYPKTIYDLFFGTQLLYVGLYNNSGIFEVALRGDMRLEPFEHVKSITFPDTLGGHRFVPRLWANAKIDHLLDLIDTYGESDELVNQIIELSLRFQILTPYTAFYSDPNEDNPNDNTDTDSQKQLPDQFTLQQNYPNPFNATTVISYELPADAANYSVLIRIYDLNGKLIAILVNERQNPGQYRISWNATDDAGQPLPSGIYLCSIRAGEFSTTRKMVLLR